MAILKVKAENRQTFWWEFHNIRKISHSGFVSRQEFEGDFYADVHLIDGEKDWFNLVVIRYMDGKEESIIFSKEAYIMSDTGETTSIIPEA